MLQLKDIRKIYGGKKTEKVEALKGVSIEFRENEFVSILGQSGCGKTTLLNIIGGLDKYTSGDLIINGKSTKQFTDRDWDSYRNHSIGFVFQSYNLIQHQTILTNVEIALTLAGISKQERRKRAIEALKTVGLGSKLNKKPSELSGGQMQRVAIARALVGNPDILLADEPTGALDSETSIQIMDLLKEIAKDRLVIMVTHNPELAEKYSTRIINLLDGKVIGDSDPYSSTEADIENAKKKTKKFKRTGMNFKTALLLSFKNLLNKKGRTFLTSFAGSIGIIGIALILSVSNGMQNYVDNLQRDSMASSPITINTVSQDITSMVSAINSEINRPTDVEEGKIGSADDISKGLQESTLKRNNIGEFKKYVERNDELKQYTTAIQYSYDTTLNVYETNGNNVVKINPDPLGVNTQQSSTDEYDYTATNFFTEIYASDDLIYSQYDLIAGKLPVNYNELVLIVDSKRTIPETVLYALNLKDRKEYKEIKNKVRKGEEVEVGSTSYSYDVFLNKTFKVILPSSYYAKENGIWVNKSDDQAYIKKIADDGEDIKIVGIIKVKEGMAMSEAPSGGIGYRHELLEHIINATNNSEIVKEQLENPTKDIFTGSNFETNDFIDSMSIDEINALVSENMGDESDQIAQYLDSMSEEEIKNMFKSQNASEATYEDNLKKIGYIDLEAPTRMLIYPKDFESKKKVEDYIKKYNDEKIANGEKNLEIYYEDFVKMMTNGMSNIIRIITGVLIAFVAISLVVSSIMISIITYISVLERTKEIGILRAIGASKKDVSRLFNAETFIEGLVAGTMGIVITFLLNMVINKILESMYSVANMASLGIVPAIILIALSVGLTVFAGLVPSKSASKKDPVEALRTE